MRQADRFVCHFLVAALVSIGAVGCGSGVEMGKVTGKVTYNSQPVKDGDLTFTPIVAPGGKEDPRQPGLAAIDNGSFTASTQKQGDGLGVGKYNVAFTARNPPWEAPEYDGTGPEPVAPKSEYAGLAPKETQVEIKAGTNDLTIELIPASTSP
jgi:hypothetical protein